MDLSHEDSKAKTESTAQAADWNEHEHVSEQVQRDAQRLVDQAGSPGIAKLAIEVIERKHGKSRSDGSDGPNAIEDHSP